LQNKISGKVIDCENSEELAQAGIEVREEGCTVVYPTDTVYGLGANPLSEEAVGKCFSLKNRERNKSFPILFSRIEKVGEFVSLDDMALELAKEFWPGKLTLVLRVKPGIGLAKSLLKEGSLAVRIPMHECALRVIEYCGGALVGTSANDSGKRPFVRWDEPGMDDFASKADFFVKGVCGSSSAEPSTILDLTRCKPEIIREGAIKAEQVFSYLSKIRSTDFSASIKGS
jgi:L-threonylcarbamoyladenylate synthase